MDDLLYVIMPNDTVTGIVKDVMNTISMNFNIKVIKHVEDEANFRNKKLLFVAQTNYIGCDIPMITFLENLYKTDKNGFENSTAALFIASSDDEGTKRTAQDIVYIANNMGCTFIGHPLVEATASLNNFLTWQKTIDLSLHEICLLKSGELLKRLIEDTDTIIENPNLMVLYAIPHCSSNTLDLWHMVAKHLDSSISLREIELKNKEIFDCIGCPYKLCTHFGMTKGCFYGGFITENILPAIEESDAIVWLCPNYNDSISANLAAVINRLTVLYRRIKFYDKSMFTVVVSGNSGSDSVTKQLIGSLNINKGFRLPPYFSIRKIANDPKSIFKIKDIESDAESFANTINSSIKKSH